MRIGKRETAKLSEKIRKTTSDWSWADKWGQVKCRTSAYRMTYVVAPGLYSLSEPDRNSDIFVSANYKLSFDILRRSLKGLNAWILVLDTNGINVWCAAGKGTFGTGELIKRINEAQLDTVVDHKKIIVPQLGAVGVNGRAVHKATGFKVFFGPVEAKDVQEYIRAGYRKTDAMRTISFPIADRVILTPMEINPAMKMYPLFALIILLIFGLQPSGILFRDAWLGGKPFLLLGLAAIFSGAFLTPALLPFVPFRSFAVKGWITGTLSVFACMTFLNIPFQGNFLLYLTSYLFFPFASSYLALQFTGSTTFTGMSGVKKELKIAVPLYLAVTAISVILLIINRLLTWGTL